MSWNVWETILTCVRAARSTHSLASLSLFSVLKKHPSVLKKTSREHNRCTLCVLGLCSLTVQVQRMKGPNPVEERDPIFERGSTTTYSSFRKGTYTKPWSNRGVNRNIPRRGLSCRTSIVRSCSLFACACWLCFSRDGHVLLGYQHGGDGLLHDRTAVSSSSSNWD